MTFSKTFIIALGISVAFSSVLSASFQEDQQERTKKGSKFSTEQRKNASALIKKHQNAPTAPSEPKGCRENYHIVYKDPMSGNLVHAE